MSDLWAQKHLVLHIMTMLSAMALLHVIYYALGHSDATSLYDQSTDKAT